VFLYNLSSVPPIIPPVLLFNQGKITSRMYFGDLLNELGLSGEAVEIGTYRGEFAHMLLVTWQGKLHCVDPWESGYDEIDPASASDMDEAYRVCMNKLRKYGNRVNILRMTSVEAAKQFHKESLSFAYIDGCHQVASVTQDLTLWWDRLKKGGILAGHDIVCPGELEGGWGRMIQLPVFLHAQMHHVTIYLVPERDGLPWSYYMVKP
jgi:predicted O-methyltransferase YrrM